MKNTNLFADTRLKKLEIAFSDKVKNSADGILLDVLKGHFPKRASIQTVKRIVNASPLFTLVGDTVFTSTSIRADITYSITGGTVTDVYFGTNHSHATSGTVYGVDLVGPAFTFELKIVQERVSPYTFDTSAIITNGKSRKLVAPVQKNEVLYIDYIPTILN